jgi:zinc/manganese transport system permease protein
VLAAFQAMGTLMAVGLMMLPAVAARHWSRELAGMTYAAVGLAALSAVCGLLLSYHADLPSGPAIVLTAGALWAVSVLAGPVDGLAARWRRRPHLAG